MALIFGSKTHPNMKTITTCEYQYLFTTVGLNGTAEYPSGALLEIRFGKL
jgi:hypothetical protein